VLLGRFTGAAGRTGAVIRVAAIVGLTVVVVAVPLAFGAGRVP
jgi:hypothetical protein